MGFGLGLACALFRDGAITRLEMAGWYVLFHAVRKTRLMQGPTLIG